MFVFLRKGIGYNRDRKSQEAKHKRQPQWQSAGPVPKPPEAMPPRMSKPGASLAVCAFPRQVQTVIPKKELLVSYLAAVSQFPKDLFDSIQHLSEVNSNEAPDTNDTHYFNLLSQCFRTDFEGSMISGALQVAIEEVNANPDLLSDYELVYLFNNTCGDEKRSTEYFMDHWKRGAKVFIGPEMNCRTEATMAAAQNLPIISYKCKDETVSDKKKYPTFARTVPAETAITKALISLLKHYNWHKFTIIYEQHSRNEELHSAIKAAIELENRENAKEKAFSIRNVSVVPYPFSEVEKSNVEQIISDTHVNTRIYLTFGNVRLFRRILLAMGGLGLMDNNEYMLIYLDTDYNWYNVYHAMNNHFFRDTLIEVSESWDVPNSPDRQVVNYSKTALAIIPTPVKLDSPMFTTFWQKANQFLVNFGVQKHHTALSIKANRFACYLYDAVMLYAMALDELIRENAHNPSYNALEDGASIIAKVVGRKYSSMQGFDMRIDEHGNAQGNYTLLSLQSVTPVLNASDPDYYPLDEALTISADFVGDDEVAALPILRFTKTIRWPNVEPPLDEPPCGFEGEKCRQTMDWTFHLMWILVLTFMVITSVVIGVVCWRNQKSERELSMIWKISENEFNKKVQRTESTQSLYDGETDRASIQITENEFPFNGIKSVGLLKGAVVAIKELIYKKPRDISRATKIQMKQLRQLHHDNVNSFFGIIIGYNMISIVREYCPKGSLMDLLMNKNFKTESLFIASFVEDLIRGMIYLHESEIKVHGNLKSTNCLITARFALQVADFGLEELREGANTNDEFLWESYLWTSPELLREVSWGQVVRGTQKGDIYSFGIILHELMAREGPYHISFEMIERDSMEKEKRRLKIEETVKRVYKCNNFRPSLTHVDCQNYVTDTMTQCWSENPDHRPGFRAIKPKLKQLLEAVRKKNVFEIMMERYQRQLEEIVDDRTKQLVEEKRRTELLLQRMLPSSVALQLLNGRDVEPELFNGVSIYFSDIVGFTQISGQSSPMEVVDFLNKLYTIFDKIINKYNVYKVETIGDAYMVVSGVPVNTSICDHAEQIGTMALHLLSAVENFTIPHRPEDKLKLRIGIHTGSVVAGVVGQTMPRYCLFGDTVNTASRMESYGQALKIHVSEQFVNALTPAMNFEVVERGELEVKGKGKMNTFWLLERRGHEFVSTESDGDESEDENVLQPRASVRNIASNWNLNKGSLLSLRIPATTSHFKRLYNNAACPTPLVQQKNNVTIVNRAFNSDLLESAENGESGMFRKSCSTIASFDEQNFKDGITRDSFDNCDNFPLRKRSTSLPDGEVLKLNEVNVSPFHTFNTAPHSSTASPIIAQRKMAIANGNGIFVDEPFHPTPNSIPDPNNDPTTADKAIRKRSVSYSGPKADMDAIFPSHGGNTNVNYPLISPPLNKKRRRKQRASVLSLQYDDERIQKKPFIHPNLRDKSPAPSFGRMLKLLKGEPKDSNNSISNGIKESLPNGHHTNGKPFIGKLSSKDDALDKLLEENESGRSNFYN
uniref:Guanylate cyclase n=1 Tax=Panagrellus redivivus TaxID=6233 RepID=A0A7E4URV4_PANRE